MTELRAIDVDQWARREHFEHYRHRVPCAYEVTVELDVTAFVEPVRVTGRRTYASQLWAVATVVNRHDEFRMQLLDDGSPAVWDCVHPMFTVFHPDTETFSALVVPYDDDFSAFHDAAVSTMAQYRDDTRMFPQDDRPRNVFDVSTLPGRRSPGSRCRCATAGTTCCRSSRSAGTGPLGTGRCCRWRCTSTTQPPTASTRPGCWASSRSSSPTRTGSADPARSPTASPTLTP